MATILCFPGDDRQGLLARQREEEPSPGGCEPCEAELGARPNWPYLGTGNKLFLAASKRLASFGVPRATETETGAFLGSPPDER